MCYSERDLIEARERGFKRMDNFAKYRVCIKRYLRKSNILFNKEMSTKDLEDLIPKGGGMKMEMYIESENGHDTLKLPEDPKVVQEAVEKQLKDGKWVTLEKKDGSSEIVTKKDIPDDDLDDEDKELMNWRDNTPKKVEKKVEKTYSKQDSRSTTQREEWKSKFKGVRTATSTHRAKGG